MKVALVHDYLNQYGGAERVLEELHAIWPEAPVLVAIHDPRKMPAAYRAWDIRPSWLNRVPMANRHHQALLPIYPHVFEGFDLGAYDLVISSSSGFAHGILTGSETKHICYCHSPPRFLWDYHRYAERERMGGMARALVGANLAWLRNWDRLAAERTDSWIGTSQVVRGRIRKFYGKDSIIIPPPVDTSRFEIGREKGGYFLMLLRLVGWKRPEIVVEACTRLSLPLVVAGDGRDESHLRRIAGPSIRFVGRVNDTQMRGLYRDCRALILPSEEDFGITPLEAMSAGRPVIAFGRGGVLDTHIPGRTGLLFPEQSAASLMEALTTFRDEDFDPRFIRRHAERYDRTVFRERMRQHAEAVLAGPAGAMAGPSVMPDQVPSLMDAGHG